MRKIARTITKILIMLIVVFGSSLVWFQPVWAVEADELKSYVTEIPSSTTDPVQAQPLLARLEKEISLFLTEGPFAPLFFDTGKPQPTYEFADPSDTIYSLAISLPFVSTQTADQLKDFLYQEIRQYNPLTVDQYPLTGRTRREFAPLGKRAMDFVEGRASWQPATTRSPSERLYAVWAYNHYTGDDEFLSSNWPLIERAAQEAWNNDGSNNAKIASSIAYARMCQKTGLGDSSQAVNRAAEALANRIDWEKNNQPTTKESWFIEREGLFIDSNWGKGGRIPRWEDLSPEIGAVLYDYCFEETNKLNNFIDIFIPLGYTTQTIAFYTRMENANQWPKDARAVFLVKALALDYSPEQIESFISAPWGKGDPWFIEKLVYAIRAYGDEVLPSPPLSPSPSPSPSAMPGDLNNDNQVNILDLVIVGGSFGKKQGEAGYDSRADANNSGGAIDIFDLVVVGNNFS